MDKYGTHQTALLRAVLATGGPVLELGCGDYSTPLLHEICKFQKRVLVSVESDKDWLETFRPRMESSLHLFRHSDWSDLTVLSIFKWSVVFVDQAPDEARVECIKFLRPITEMFVVHDVEPGNPVGPVLFNFKWRVDFKEQLPWTAIVSDSQTMIGMVS